ncbi:MAG TPA: hypothetical protein VIB48_15355 [Acidimicrobiia bacterium]|jgi:hypothetical protein
MPDVTVGGAVEAAVTFDDVVPGVEVVVGADVVVVLDVVDVVDVDVLDVRVVGDSVVVVVRDVELVEAAPVVAAVLVEPGPLVTAPGADDVGPPAEVLVRGGRDWLLDPHAPRTSTATIRTRGATRRQ